VIILLITGYIIGLAYTWVVICKAIIEVQENKDPLPEPMLAFVTSLILGVLGWPLLWMAVYYNRRETRQT
jgi:hypothetical protein